MLQSQHSGIHPKSFIEMSSVSRDHKNNSRIRSTSPSNRNIRRSMSSQRSNNSLSRSTSNTLSSKLNIITSVGSGSSRQSDNNPFMDSDDDWNDDFDDFNKNLNKKDSIIDDKIVGINNLSLTDNNESDAINDEIDQIDEVDENYPFLKKNYQAIMKDPFFILSSSKPYPNDDVLKYNKIVKELNKSTFELSTLKTQSWSGIPPSLRALVWQILVGYLSTNKTTRVSNLSRKRKEYNNSILRLFKTEKDQQIWHQIKIDVLRTNPTIKLYSFEETHRSLEKILYLWAVRHPASGYVQGINDLITPFFQVFLSHYLASNINVEDFDPQSLPKELLNVIEADTYWCFTKVLDTIQDNFIHEQPGIIRQINELKNLIKRDEPQLSAHFENENLDFIQFTFRWMNCMLMREFKLNLIIRMWDTYLSDFPTGFSQFHVYVCCAFLRRFSDHLLEMDFQDIIMFLQDTSKTADWNEDDIEMMLSEAFVWQSLYENASAHLK